MAGNLSSIGPFWSNVFKLCAILFTCLNVYFSKKRLRSVLRPPLLIGVPLIIITKKYMLCLQLGNYDIGWLILGLIIGQGLFLVSVAINRLSIAETLNHAISLKSQLQYYRQHPLTTLRSVLVSFYEELLWRGTIIYLLGNSCSAVIITSLWFASVHLHKRKEFIWIEWLDFLLFSAVLGFLFIITSNLFFVIGIHTIRNLNVAWYVYQQEGAHSIPSRCNNGNN